MNTNSNLTVTGVDLGSSAVKIAAVLKGGVQIITNQANFRQTPNIIGFGQKQRLIGQAGQVKIKSNHSNTVTAPSRFLGFDQNCEYLKQQLKFCPARSQKMQTESSSLTFNLQYNNQRQPFTVQQLVASYLTEIQKIIAQTNNLSNKNLVISVPSYFTQHQRIALLNAVQICKKKLNTQYATQLVDQQIAASMEYGYSKRNQFSEDLQKAKKVLFIDFGHSKTNVFVTAFNKQHLRILANKFQRQLGCKFLDQQLLKFYANKFDTAHPNMQLNLLQSKKAVLKLLESIQKQRKVLSGNMQHDLSIECLLEDQDLQYTMKRQQYEEICKPVIQKFKDILNDFLNQLKQKGITYDQIQLIGGGTRIPVIIHTISQVFGQQPSRTINSSQCIAKGAALISAMNSSIFRVQPYSFFSLSPYTVQIKINGEKINKTLIDKNQLLLKQKSIEIQLQKSLQKINILAEYQSIEKGLKTKIFEVEAEIQSKLKQKQQNKTQMKQESQESTKFNLLISLDQSGLIKFNKLVSLKSNVSFKSTKVNYFQKYNAGQLAKMQQKQKQMTIRDFQIKKFYQKKNKYESFIYKTKHNLNQLVQNNKQYVNQSQVNQLKSPIQNQQNLLNSGNQLDLKHQEFAHKQKTINHKLQQFSKLIHHLKQAHQVVNSELQKLADLLNQIIQKRSQNMYPDYVNKVGQWINEVFEKQKTSPKCNAPIVTVQQVKQTHQEVLRQINSFDQQMQRQRQMNMRKTRQNQPRSQYGTNYHRPNQTSYHPYTYEDQYRPRTTRSSRGGYHNNSNPFGSFFGSGFSGFF